MPNTLHLQRYLRPAAADVPELTNANQWPFIRAAFSHWASRFPTTRLVLFPPPPQFHKNPHPPTVWDKDATNRKIIFSMVKLVVFQPSCCAISVSERHDFQWIESLLTSYCPISIASGLGFLGANSDICVTHRCNYHLLAPLVNPDTELHVNSLELHGTLQSSLNGLFQMLHFWHDCDFALNKKRRKILY